MKSEKPQHGYGCELLNVKLVKCKVAGVSGISVSVNVNVRSARVKSKR